MASLPDLPRRLVSLALFRGMDHAEIARHAGLTLDEVHSAMREALAALEGGAGVASLESILYTSELAGRDTRAPDFAAENRALVALAQELARPAGNVLSRLARSAMELCGAHTAGISILESGEDGIVFRWNSVVGKLAVAQGGFLPRSASPCGVVIDTDAVQLVVRPDRHFSAVRPVSPRIVEALLVPFRMLGEPVGTIWVVAHDDQVHFDAEDARVMSSLAAFASAAYVLLSTQQAALDGCDELVRANDRLRRSNDRLWGKLVENRVVEAGDTFA